MVNRESNVFPGILGRVCDRPCEPACRRGRIEEKPVAICRLKRVAADNRDDIDRAATARRRSKRTASKVACIGAGPASLTVANDLLPLGYEVTIFEQYAVPGGLMRTNIPAFRLPAKVLDEEIGYIVDMGADLRLNSPVKSMRALLEDGGFDAVFVGSGAPKGKELELPGPARHRPHPHRHHLARVGGLRAHRQDRRARADHRRRQYRHGLLPQLTAPRRQGGEGHGAQAAPVLQGLRVGTRGRGSTRTSRSSSTTRPSRSWSRTACSRA